MKNRNTEIGHRRSTFVFAVPPRLLCSGLIAFRQVPVADGDPELPLVEVDGRDCRADGIFAGIHSGS